MFDGAEPTVFQASVRSSLATTVFVLRGELDLATVPRFMAVLDRELCRAAPEVVFDLSGVGFMDLAGARAVLRTVTRARSTGRVASAASPTPAVERLLHLLEIASELGLGSPRQQPVTSHRFGAPIRLVAGAIP